MNSNQQQWQQNSKARHHQQQHRHDWVDCDIRIPALGQAQLLHDISCLYLSIQIPLKTEVSSAQVCKLFTCADQNGACGQDYPHPHHLISRLLQFDHEGPVKALVRECVGTSWLEIINFMQLPSSLSLSFLCNSMLLPIAGVDADIVKPQKWGAARLLYLWPAKFHVVDMTVTSICILWWWCKFSSSNCNARILNILQFQSLYKKCQLSIIQSNLLQRYSFIHENNKELWGRRLWARQSECSAVVHWD